MFKKEDPNLIFFQETKVKALYLGLKKFKFGFKNGLAINSEGKSGDFAIFWEDIDFEILQFSKHHIHGSLISGSRYATKWFVTGVYGHPDEAWRPEVWAL